MFPIYDPVFFFSFPIMFLNTFFLKIVKLDIVRQGLKVTFQIVGRKLYKNTKKST